MGPDFVNRVDIIDKNFDPKSFFGPTTQQSYFTFFLPPIFQKFGGQKKCKITFLGCGTKKRFRVKILIDYIYPIDEIWAHLEYVNIRYLKNRFLGY